MPTRINGGSVLAGLGGLLVFVSLFLDWFEPSRTAWTVFEISDLVLAALAAITLVAAAGSLRPSTWLPSERTIPYAGIGALIIVVATLIQHPPTALHSSPEIGAWLALLGAAMVTAGGFLMRARVSIVVTLRPRDRTSRTSSVRVAQRPEGTMPTPPPSEPEYETAYESEPGFESEPEYEPAYEPEPGHETESEYEPAYEPEPGDELDDQYEEQPVPEAHWTETQPIRDQRQR